MTHTNASFVDLLELLDYVVEHAAEFEWNGDTCVIETHEGGTEHVHYYGPTARPQGCAPAPLPEWTGGSLTDADRRRFARERERS